MQPMNPNVPVIFGQVRACLAYKQWTREAGQSRMTESSTPKNVLDQPLENCSLDPLTGWFRDGFCRTDGADVGSHTVCSEMTGEFLRFTASLGNDLSTRRGGFPGLSPGDRWCLCSSRWREAYLSGVAPPVVLESTHKKTLELNSIADLRRAQDSEAEPLR